MRAIDRKTDCRHEQAVPKEERNTMGQYTYEKCSASPVIK
jgi:hypothetical protein